MSNFWNKYQIKKRILLMLLAAAPAAFILNGCKQEEPETTPPIIDIDYSKEDYYNRFPIQVYIDDNFSEHSKSLVIESLSELDEAIKGLTFEYHSLSEQYSVDDLYHSYIFINYDKDGIKTLNKYEESSEENNMYGSARNYNNIKFNVNKNGINYSIEHFKSEVIIGGYFTIGDEIPESNNIMGLELRWNNNKKYGAYNKSFYFIYDNGFWNFDTTYNEFKSNINNAFKSLIKHEASHSLGYEGDISDGCGSGKNCHSSDKNSLMSPYLTREKALKKDQITNDVIEFFKEKYPSKQNTSTATNPNINARVDFYDNRIRIALSSVDREIMSQLIKDLTDKFKNKNNVKSEEYNL